MTNQETVQLVDEPPQYSDIYSSKTYDEYRSRVKKYEDLLKRQDALEKNMDHNTTCIICIDICIVILMISTCIILFLISNCPDNKQTNLYILLYSTLVIIYIR